LSANQRLKPFRKRSYGFLQLNPLQSPFFHLLAVAGHAPSQLLRLTFQVSDAAQAGLTLFLEGCRLYPDGGDPFAGRG